MSARRRASSPDALDLFAAEPPHAAAAEPLAQPLAPPLAPLPDEAPAPVARRGRGDRVKRRDVGAPYDRRANAHVAEPALPEGLLVDPYAHDDAPEDPEDAIPGATPRSAVSVATLTRTAKDVIEGAFVPLWVRGEVSDFKRHRNGHWYFCLRDGEAQIRCVVWRGDQRRIPAPPDEGMQVTALAQVTVYAARGDLQLSVKAMEAEGDGLWRKALEATLQRLTADGLLDPSRKRSIPRMPRRVAVVTSPDGAALHDIVAVARRRCPGVEIVVVPAKVQGDGAPEEICAALARIDRWIRGAAAAGAPVPVDTVIVGRGGGAREDLWAFNDEGVVRAVAACRVPIISAVGHEVDMTLCDLVADLRAPTPSAAAESAVPVRDELLAEVRDLGSALADRAQALVADARDRLAFAGEQLAGRAGRLVERRQARLAQAAGRLQALSPLATLARGYAVARDTSGVALTSATRFTPGMPFALVLRDGTVRATTDGRADRDALARESA